MPSAAARTSATRAPTDSHVRAGGSAGCTRTRWIACACSFECSRGPCWSGRRGSSDGRRGGCRAATAPSILQHQVPATLCWHSPGVRARFQLPPPGTLVAEVTSPLLADALRDRYVLERELGRGGMAVVYLALDLKHKRPVALKVLHPELAAALGPERFQREIELAARLQHPHILPVFDSGDAAGQL